MRNVDSFFNKEGPIEHIVEVNIYYQEHRKRTEIDVIGGQKWSVILGMPWLACHNPEIDWRTEEVGIMKCLEECEKQWRPKQGKLEQQKQKEEEKKEEERNKQEEREQKKEEEKEKKKRPKKKRMIEVKKEVEKWEIWDEEKKVAKLEKEVKKLVPLRFYEQIHVFERKASKRMLTRNVWNYVIETKEGFVLRKEKMYPLLREERCTSSLKNN